MSEKHTTPEKAAETIGDVAQVLKADHVLMRQHQLQQQLQQTNKQIMEARQQKAFIEDMITGYTIEAAEIRGAMKENAAQQQKG